MTRRANVLAIMSPKGGVGKTVTAVNLAVALAEKFKKRILLIDTNVSTASLGMHLNIIYPKTTINDIAEKKSWGGILHFHSENLHVIPASIKIRKKKRDPKQMLAEINNIIEQYEEILEKFHKDYDIVIMDCAPGFDVESLATMQIAGGMIVITNPEYPSLVSAARCIEYARHSKMPVGGMVLTKVRGKRHELKKDEIEKALNIKILQEIPYDKRISESINKRIPLVLLHPFSRAARAYKRLAASLVENNKKENFFSRFKRILKIR